MKIRSAGVCLFLSTCLFSQNPSVHEVGFLQGGGTYSIIQTLKAGQILAPFTPTEGANASEEEICYCKAKVTQANPPFGSFYVWAVGIYHSLTWFGCFYPQGPVGLLWLSRCANGRRKSSWSLPFHHHPIRRNGCRYR